MTPARIVGRADIAAIEARPYAEFMPFTHVGQALEAVAARHPDRIAIEFISAAEPDAPVERWTHAEFVARLRGLAQALREITAPARPVVALLAPPVPLGWLAFWAAECAGTVCPINSQLDSASIEALIRAAQANVLAVIGDAPGFDAECRLPALQTACLGLRAVLVAGAAAARVGGTIDVQTLLRHGGTAPPLVGPTSHSGDLQDELPVALFHTGGTTGAPKLWRQTHRNQLHAAWGGALLMAMDEHDMVFNGFPLFHVAGPLVYGLSTLLAGGCVLLPTAQGMRNKALVQRFWQLVQAHRVSLIACVPTFISSLLEVDPGGADLGSVRGLFTGGAPLPGELARRFELRLGIPVRNVLGMTECAGTICVEPLLAPRVAGSCGLPIPFTTVIVAADADPGEAAKVVATDAEPPIGISGALLVAGPGVGPGYVSGCGPSQALDAAGRLRTGDLGCRLADGRVAVTGRAKDLIIRGGHNIDPAVIELALLQHAAVAMAAAVGQPDEYAGELPMAFVTLRSGAVATAADLLAFARRHIPEPAACPKHIEILEALPMTPIGKVFKTALRRLATLRVIHARLASLPGVPLGPDRVRVEAVDEGGQLSLVFTPASCRFDPPEQAMLKALMAGFALGYRLMDEPA